MQNISINLNPTIPAIPVISDKTKINVRYAVISPYVFIHIYWNEKDNELVYEVEEPVLNDNQKELLKKIEDSMIELININIVVQKNQDAMIEYINQTASIIITELGLKISEEDYRRIFYYLYRDFVGLNEIEPLIRDYFIEDIECNGINTPIYIIHRAFKNLRTNIRFTSIERISSFVEKIAQRCGKYISYASPIMDGSLPDGSRVNATYSQEISSRGPTFTIRKFTKIPWTPTQLITFKTLSPEMLAYMWILIQYKCNILVAGGTASGKTTLLNAASFFIPPESRVVSIEDSVTGDSKLTIRIKGKIKNITIKEFVENKIDAEVMSLDEKGKVVWVKPSAYIKHKVTKDIYEILTSTGRRIKVTQDHSLFSLGENNVLKEIKPTELIAQKSFIAVPRILPIEGQEIKEINLMDSLKFFKDDFLQGDPLHKILEKYSYQELEVAKEKRRWWKNHDIIKISDFLKLNVNFSYEELKQLRIKSKNTSSIPVIFPITDNFLEFCGLWLGDGSYDNYNKNSVIVSNIDEECRNLIRGIAKQFDLNYSLMNDDGVSIRIHSTVLYKLMKYCLGFDGYSNSKTIPELIFGLSKNQVACFIRGYFSADGTMKKHEASCSSQSLAILEDLQSLLLRFGIISRINDFYRKDKCINMSISSSKNLESFKEIGFLQERKNNKLLSIIKIATHTCSDIIPLSSNKILELKKISESYVGSKYVNGISNMGREFMQKIAPTGSEFNDISHNDILWDKVKLVKKISSEDIEVFDLSIPGFEKFLCNNIFVHNTRELSLSRENWLPSVARSSVGVGNIGEVSMFNLLKSSFRQAPDYVIVGEVRGEEANVLFQGMASGHASLSTIHADSVDTLIKRLETPPINLSPTLINTIDAVAIMTHAIVGKKETRKLREIVEIVDVNPDGIAITNTPFIWNARDDQFYFKKSSHVFEKISRRYGFTIPELEKEFKLRTMLLNELARRSIFGFKEVQDIINHYFKNPEAVLASFGISLPV